MSFELVDRDTANGGNGDALFDAFGKVIALQQAANDGGLQGHKNKFINGSLECWQRATSQTATGLSSADRLYFATDDASFVASRQALTPGEIAAPLRYFLRVAKPTATDFAYFRQRIEDVRALVPGTATLSFWGKSPESVILSDIGLYQDFGSGGSSKVFNTFETNIALTTSWVRYEFDVVLPSISGKTIGTDSFLEAFFNLFAVGSAGGTVDITGIQIEQGATATAFERRHEAIELDLCRRYCEIKTVRAENGARHIPLYPKRATPSVSVGVGSAGNITPHGFELSHGAAADCLVTAISELG